ncbi:phage holin family protein [Corallococcus exiguus]|uniref:phage holin family protein n=1 Tax=Corallococcus TaxID=83461 RepID=UPI000EC23669|nr:MULTISPECIES: phage holin family protein [Corallococcus]NNB95622.1 phage holin family protein [Corallococcus exiguus]RKH77735.1 phage holin family protein [Corallococcus sp. AB032C]
MHVGSEQTDRGVAALVGRMADGFSRLVTQHLQLARVELAEDAKAMGLDVASIAVFVPFLLVGYAFVCGALAAVLAPWTGWAGALALVGAVNLVGGGLGILRAVKRMKSRQMMDDSVSELSRSMAALTNAQPRVSAAPGVNTLKDATGMAFKEPRDGR